MKKYTKSEKEKIIFGIMSILFVIIVIVVTIYRLGSTNHYQEEIITSDSIAVSKTEFAQILEDGSVSVEDRDQTEIESSFKGKAKQLLTGEYLCILDEAGLIHSECTYDIEKVPQNNGEGALLASMKIITEYNREHPFLCISGNFPSSEFLALLEDGSIMGVNHLNYEEPMIYRCENEKAIDISGCYALTEDGNVYRIDTEHGKISKVEEFKNIRAIDSSLDDCVGIHTDGTVIYNGRNEWGQGNVDDWDDIKSVELGKCFCVGLKRDGTVIMTGKIVGDIDVSAEIAHWKNIKTIATDDYYCIAALTENGKVLYAE